MTLRLRPAGDRALLVDVDDNAAAVRLARHLRGQPGLVDVVPGHRTVLVTWAGEPPELDLSAAAADAAPAVAGRLFEVRVRYDGDDLAEVARLTGRSVDEVVDLHTAVEHTVGFLGFAPGFAYLLGSDERLHVPRLETPRPRVPAGAVAIAGPYSAVYPRESPGGWRLLGRTELVLFDPARQPPALLAAGDRVRFVRA